LHLFFCGDEDPGDVTMKEMSNLERKLRMGQFVVCGEMSPPLSADPEVIRKKCSFFRGMVDAVNLTDNQSGVVRMSSLVSSLLVLQEGLEPIMQLTCRDRNRLAQQSDLLGAHAMGIRNVLCLTGDHQSFGNHPDARGVFDLDSIQLIRAAQGMNDGHFMCGDEIKTPPSLFIGGAANPFGISFEMQLIRLRKKIASGVQFIQTQPIFDLERFKRWMDAVRARGFQEQVFILAGVMPVKSVKVLEYLKESVPGMSIPKDTLRRMKSDADPKEEGIAICIEMIQQLRQVPDVHGIHLMPVMWESVTPRIIEEAGLLSRSKPRELVRGIA
jgi:methylenetetrahydrofolate reductase (NADPH)